MKRNKAIAQIKKIFKEKDLTNCKFIAIENLKGYMSPCNCFMIVPKTNICLELLTANFELGEPQKVPELNYKDLEGHSGKYSIEFLKVILEFIQCFNEESSIKLSLGKDYPLSVDMEHFKIILAPRVEND